MTRPIRLLTCLIAAAALGLGVFELSTPSVEAQAKPKAKASAIGVVNLQTLISKSQRNIAYQEQVDKKLAGYQKEREEKERKINLMRADLDVIADAEARAKKEREVIQAISEYQAWNQIQQQFMQRDRTRSLIEIYDEIDKTVKQVAQREGYDMVFKDATTPDFERLNAEQLVNVISSRQIIYRSKSVDLTEAVLAQMNLNYVKEGNP